MISLYYMNIHFNKLSRYPYDNERAKSLILQYMDDDEIEYIVDYSIEPKYFINYIDKQGFNIYHVDYYNELKYYSPNLNEQSIVTIVEAMIKSELDLNRALPMVQNYTLTEIIEYFAMEKASD